MENIEFCENKIAVIDMNEFGENEMEWYKKLRRVCEDKGYCRIINHGVSHHLMSEMKSVVRSLFDRPIEIKRRNVDVIISSGYAPTSKDNLFNEALGFYGLGSSQAHSTFSDQLDANFHQRGVIEKYSAEVHKLTRDIGRKLTKSIGLDGDLFKEWPCQMRINKFHFSQECLGMAAMRAHTDSGFLTILQDDDVVEGLELINKSNGKFEAVNPWPGTFLLFLGDVAKAWSNGRFATVAHTVRCKNANPRFSIASFLLGPSEGKVVEAPAELVDDEHPRLYAPFIYEDYRALRISKRMLEREALDLIRVEHIRL